MAIRTSRKAGHVQADDLAVFLRLANSESLSETARTLNLPKSSISRVVARLEAVATVPLFDRSSRHFRLSDAGQTLRPHAVRVVEEMEHAQAALDTFVTEPQGLLRVNTSPAFAQGIIAPMLPSYLDRNPRVIVDLVVEQQFTNLTTSNADLLVRVGRLSDSDHVAKPLPPVPVWLCASPQYLRTHPKIQDPSDLLRHSIISRNTINRWSFRKGNLHKVLDVPSRAIIEDAAACRAVLEGGAGLGYLPSFLAKPAMQAGGLIRVLDAWVRTPIEVHAMYRRHRLASPKVRDFINLLTTCMRAALSASSASVE